MVLPDFKYITFCGDNMLFCELEKLLPKQDIWMYLEKTQKPIVMYGMGNGAEKIIEALSLRGVEISDFFASDGFVRGQSFRGKKVMSFSEIKAKYNDFIILVSFGSKLDDVIDHISSISKNYELYLPDVPVSGSDVFDLKFFNVNRDRIKYCFDILADDTSKAILADMIMYKLTGKIEHLLNTTSDEKEYIKKIFDTENWVNCIDLGAYDGDTSRQLIEIASHVKRIIAFEPDAKNFKKLNSNPANVNLPLEAYNLCAWNKREVLKFERSGNRNSAVNKQSHTPSVGDTKFISVSADTVDSIVGKAPIDYIKFDVEGSEREALEGALQTVQKNLPDILMAIYHKSCDLFELPILLHEILPDHELYIRRKRCLPAWEINILAKKT